MSAEGQIKSYFERWENLEAEKKQTADALKDLFAEAKAFGFNTKALRAAFNLKVKQDLDSPKDAEFEAVVDTYVSALNAPKVQARDARMRARENIEEFDPITGEFIEASNGGPSAVRPSLAARDVEESAVSDPVANVVEGATSTTAAVSNDPASRADDESERQHSSTVGFADDCRTGGKEQSDASAAPVGDAGAYAEGIPVSNGSRPADPAVSGGEPGTPSSDASGEKMELGATPVPGRRDVKSPHSNAESERATNTNSEIDPHEDREEGLSLGTDAIGNVASDGSADANTGGGHVNAHENAATLNNRLDGVAVQSVKKPLRPLCRNPGETCGGYGSTHCASCLRAFKEEQAA